MKQWRKAFGILLGLQLFVSGEDDWIRHQEVYTEFEEFGGWFSDYSSAWFATLLHSVVEWVVTEAATRYKK